MIFVLPAVLFLVGVWIGSWCVARYKSQLPRTAWVTGFACVVLAFLAMVASSSQVWWDLGLAYDIIQFAESASVFVFAVVLGGTCRLVSPSKRRWWLLAAVPVGLAQLLQFALMVIVWSTYGFAP